MKNEVKRRCRGCKHLNSDAYKAVGKTVCYEIGEELRGASRAAREVKENSTQAETCVFFRALENTHDKL